MAQQMYLKGSLISRCIASIIDGFILGRLCGIMDSINQGKGIGKGMMGIRTIDYKTGGPPTLVQSCLRNYCNFIPCLACIGEGRHLGDMIAGTMVIKDV
ncbi:MAG: hypothetical protein OEZ01_18000 [Candidatus Heimdallarchaeota archaeon]|nr:hypothetical protein [Candidatus Heimdallarchaeota archaeon]MDH5647908.1 hypothetical protein [Candidatus Heimdallarchaeota archaeon]